MRPGSCVQCGPVGARADEFSGRYLVSCMALNSMGDIGISVMRSTLLRCASSSTAYFFCLPVCTCTASTCACMCCWYAMPVEKLKEYSLVCFLLRVRRLTSCFALIWFALLFIALHCFALLCISLICLLCIALLCVALLCIALLCIA